MSARPPLPEKVALLERLVAALAERGHLTEAALAAQQERTDAGGPAIGARMVARAWLDEAYRALMIEDGTRAAEAMGVNMIGAPPLGVLADTPARHHLVVCTLCSCYPRQVLGYPPGWFKSSAYRARAVREPRAVLAEWGTVLPESMDLRVVDSTADYRWMVLPLRPEGTEGWSEDQLAAIVTREVMIGTALPRAA